MPSTLSWLDYSERDRRRALDVVDLFRETGTVDELGLGAIRDSFSDLLFPGTSTIQTRACYFLLLPWTFLRLERLRVSSREAAGRAEWEEKRLNQKLLEGEDTAGVFGRRAGWALKRLPSVAYWGGLGSWGIRVFPGHIDAYFRSLDYFYRDLQIASDMPHDPEGRKASPANWHPHVPDPPPGFPDRVSVALRREDSEYLCDRIQARQPGSLLAELASAGDPSNLEYAWPWELETLDGVTPALREGLQQAKLFSVTLQGAALLYNLMLAEASTHLVKVTGNETLAETYRRELDEWATDVEALGAAVNEWDLRRVWEIARTQGRPLGFPTRAFVQGWIDLVRAAGPRKISDDQGARSLVKDREIRLKRGRARLASPHHLERWGGRSGSDRMDFRWGGARVLLRDIFDGLNREEGDAGDA
jgi:hypothetical protein